MGFRWPTMPGSGRAQVAQQIGAIGAGIGRLGEVFEEKQARVRLDDFKLRVEEDMIRLGNEISKEQDELKYQAMMEQAFSKLQGQIPKGMAGPLATSYLNNERIEQLKSVDASMEERVKSKWGAENLIAQDRYIKSGNPIPFRDSLGTGLANGYLDEKGFQSSWLSTQKKAEYRALSDSALDEPEDAIKNLDKIADPGNRQAIRSIAEGQINFRARQQDRALSSFYDDVTKKAEEGMSLREMRDILMETPGLTTKERQKAMNTFASALSTWEPGGTKENPWKTTQNYPALMEVQLAISAGEPMTEMDIWRAMFEGGNVNFSRTDALNLINQLPDKKDNSLKTPFAIEWANVIKTEFSTEEVGNKFAIPIEKIGEWTAMQQAADAIIIKHKDDPVKANNLLLELLMPTKNAHARNAARNIWRNLPSGMAGLGGSFGGPGRRVTQKDSGRIRVRKPDGTIGTIDARNRKEAEAADFTVIE